jgi:hypothetical protein
MDVIERESYVRMLAEQIERENGEIEEMRRTWK